MPTVHVKVNGQLFFVNDDKFQDAINGLEKGKQADEIRGYLSGSKERSPLKNSGIGYYDFDSIRNCAPEVVGNYYRNSPEGKRILKKYRGAGFPFQCL